ncbi:hypothetical protein N9154_03970, partial [Akkermansiaceae bacterium]|nr:hypothetical protein [Akkermansiaceae bacterium]
MHKNLNSLWCWPIACAPLIINTSEIIFKIGAFFSVIFMVQLVGFLFIKRIRFNFFSLLSISILFGYGLGTFFLFFTGALLSNTEKSISNYSVALWMTIFISSLLVFCSMFSQNIRFLSKRKDRNTNTCILVLMLIFILATYLLGGIGHGGVLKGEMGISISGAMASLIA